MSDPQLTVVADLDVPGETRRQTTVFAVWLLCGALAIAITVLRRPTSPDTSSPIAEGRMAAHKRERLLIGGGMGVLLPALLTWWVTHRRRRGGPHARGITIDVTEDGELRVWGRGYGQRIAVPGAEVTERLVDVYSGRLGAWRQRRMIIRTKRPIAGMPTELSLATPSTPEDLELDVPLVGGEGDCIEVQREDYLRLLKTARQLARTPD